MSHYVVLVIGDNVDGQLAPYDENIEVAPRWENEALTVEGYWAYEKFVTDGLMPEGGTMEDLHAAIRTAWGEEADSYRVKDGELQRRTTYNPDSKWDWYTEGGRWGEMILLKDGTKVDSARVGDIDFDTMIADAVRKANETFDRFVAVVGGEDNFENIPDWDTIRARHENIDNARTEFNDDPIIAALREANLMPWFDDLRDVYCINTPDPRAMFVRRAADSILPGYAFVKNGEWFAQGRMGWFGMSSDDVSSEDWAAEMIKMIRALPEDEFITVIDCHI